MILTLLIAFQSAATQFEVFSKDGRQGLKDDTGKEVIAPVYDELGWSVGDPKPVGDLLGYRLNKNWGVVSVKNQVVTGPMYYSLSVFDETHIKAAIKGNFSNRLFQGLMDMSGEIVISCSYFDISPLPHGYLASQYDRGRISYGFFNSSYDLKIPPEYRHISDLSPTLIAAQGFDRKWIIYNHLEGRASSKFDHVQFSDDGIVVQTNGKYGVIKEDGFSEELPQDYKAVYFDEQWHGKQFPKYTIERLTLDSSAFLYADSVELRGELFISYLNGNNEVIVDGKDIFGDRMIDLKLAKSGYLIARDLSDDKWILSKTDGKIILDRQDSIVYDESYFKVLNEGKWQVYNRFGRKLSLRGFDELGSVTANMVPCRRGDYWGLMDFQGLTPHGIKYDAIGGELDGSIAIKYLDEWGLMDLFGNWVVQPRYDSIMVSEDLFLCVKGSLTRLFTSRGSEITKTVHRIENKGKYLETTSYEGRKGIFSSLGRLIMYADYDSVGKVGALFFGKTGPFFDVVDSTGTMLMLRDEGYQQIIEQSEGYYKILKDDRFGFVDQNGKLRIANRYLNAGKFSEGLCAIEITNWGYIDKQERLIVQPNYEEAGDFDNGLAIVKSDGNYGIINNDGDWVVQPAFTKILHKRGSGYILHGPDGVGAANKNGRITLTTQFDDIVEVKNGLLIVNRNGRVGVMNQEGATKIPLKYDQIEVQGDYFIMRNLTDN